MPSTADIVALEHAALATLFSGEVNKVLARFTQPLSPLPSQQGVNLSATLVNYTKHKIGALTETGSRRLEHERSLGTIKEYMRTIADGESGRLLRAADANIAKAFKGLAAQR